MKITNFRNYRKEGSGILFSKEYADVDVETRFLWFKKKQTKSISKTVVSWFFVDTGEWTPGLIVEELEKSYHAKKGMENLK